ncbi:unnamed protein product [Rotaria socialis]
MLADYRLIGRVILYFQVLALLDDNYMLCLVNNKRINYTPYIIDNDKMLILYCLIDSLSTNEAEIENDIGINLIHLYDNKFDEDVHSKLDQGGDLVSYYEVDVHIRASLSSNGNMEEKCNMIRNKL